MAEVSNLFDGLPAGGPFDLILLAWLNLAGIPYSHTFQDDTRKGPKGKNPWIELNGERIGACEAGGPLPEGGRRYDTCFSRPHLPPPATTRC